MDASEIIQRKKREPDLRIPATADDRTRTDDLRITNALLYQLSHIGLHSNIIHECRKNARGKSKTSHFQMTARSEFLFI